MFINSDLKGVCMKPATGIILFLLNFTSNNGFAQFPSWQDSTINNLVHLPGYKTSRLGELENVKKYGSGKQTLILIPGLGFDASVFDDFMESNKGNYTMYAITIPGYGQTAAPPMPVEGTSYGEQTWDKGVVEGVVKLIDKEKLQRPVIVGHFVQGTQVALRLAIEYPGKVGGVIILGGPAKFIATGAGRIRDVPLDTMIYYTDKYTAPRWFKHMKKQWFDDNNIRPEVYSVDSTRGMEVWKQSAKVPLPVMIRYSSEFFACDVKADFDKLKCPVLVLRAMFNDKILGNSINNYVKPQYIDSWTNAPSKNSLIQVRDIPNSATFLWKDKPDEVYQYISGFLKEIKK